jgi:hypothetical protein
VRMSHPADSSISRRTSVSNLAKAIAAASPASRSVRAASGLGDFRIWIPDGILRRPFAYLRWGTRVQEFTENFLGDDDATVELLEDASLTDQNQIVDW